MELIVMIVAAFPLGYFIRNELVAFVAYIALHSFVFTFQSTDLVIEWAGGSQTAFGPFPKASHGEALSYGGVNLLIYAIGLGLVYFGHRIGSRRRAGAGAGAVHLDAAAS